MRAFPNIDNLGAMKNDYTRIIGWHVCPTQPDTQGFTVRYPWGEMEPGGLIYVEGTTYAIRSRMSSAAAAAGKRLGRKFATGAFYDENDRHTGWWACRVDGVRLEDKPVTAKQRHAASERDYVARKRRARQTALMHDPAPIQRVKPLGQATEEAGGLSAPELPGIDYATADLSAWQTPAPVPGEAAAEDAF